MKLSRRTMLKSAGVASVAAAIVPGQTIAAKPMLAVYDSRLPEARAFAAQVQAQGIRTIDIAGGDKDLWHIARQDLATPGAVSGMTGWSDWVVLRGLLEERGKRLVREARVVHKGARMATPFAWEMG
jgi:TAT (twin-arginine translocation) pathway signal sequence